MNACKECGLIREEAVIKLNSLASKIDRRLYYWKNNHFNAVEGKEPTQMELWVWREELKKIAQEL
jgi:hypothetical protein